MPPKKPQFSESADRRRNPAVLDQLKNLSSFQWFCLSPDIFEVNHNIKKSLTGNLMPLLHTLKMIAMCLCVTFPKIVAKLHSKKTILIRSC